MSETSRKFSVGPVRCALCSGPVEKVWLEEALRRKIPGAEELRHLTGYCLLHCQSCGHLSQSGVGVARMIPEGDGRVRDAQ